MGSGTLKAEGWPKAKDIGLRDTENQQGLRLRGLGLNQWARAARGKGKIKLRGLRPLQETE